MLNHRAFVPLVVPLVAAIALVGCPKEVPPPAPVVAPAPALPPPPAKLWPATKAVDVADTVQGTVLHDNYRWLEDEKSPDVQAWMKSQDAYARGELAKAPGRDALVKRFGDLFYVDSVSAPDVAGKRLFYLKTSAKQDRAVLYTKDTSKPDAPERILLDPNTWKPGPGETSAPSLGAFVPTQDGRKLAYMTNPNHADEADLHVLDVETGKDLPDLIHGAKYAEPDWVPDGSGFYYEWLPVDPTIPVDARPGYTEIRYHKLGTDPAKDRLVREKTGDPTSFLASSLSKDGRWQILYVQHGWSAVDVYVQDIKAGGKFVPLVVGQPHLYGVTVEKDRFYVYTNDGADHYKVMGGTTKDWKREDWKEIVPEDPKATLEGVAVYGGQLALTYLKDATSELKMAKLDGTGAHDIALPGLGAVSAFTGDDDQDDVYIQYSDFLTPKQVYHYSVKTGKSDVWAKVNLPIDPSPFVTEQVWYTSTDGTQIPMFLVHRKDAVKNGNNPTLLYGYGGFAVPMVPNFRASIYPFLEAGGVYAVANLRGGGEYGEAWHQAGFGAKKQNVFDDFASAARYLEGPTSWSSTSRLAIMGGSNGGLLMGAAMTQHPELYKAVVCQVPLLDMIRYQLFGSGRTWIPEYGTSEDPEQFKTLLAYSPYQHVTPGTRYPALLLASSDHDDRVDPMHARKFAAAVQAAQPDGATPVYLRIEANAGHGGADGVAAAIQAQADTWGFVMEELGVAVGGPPATVPSPVAVPVAPNPPASPAPSTPPAK